MKAHLYATALLGALSLTVLPDAATGATKSWKNAVGSGNWSVGTNWTSDDSPPNQPPALNDTVLIAHADGIARQITYDVSAPQLAGFLLDLTGPGADRTTFEMSWGTLSNIGFIIGDVGRATVNHTGGSFIQNDATLDGAIGYHAGGNGIYNLSGAASLSLAKDLYVGEGEGSSGTVNQNGGSVSIARDLRLLAGADATSTYNLTSGVLHVGRRVELRSAGFGRHLLNVAGGELNASEITNFGGGTSAVHLSAGTINVRSFGGIAPIDFSFTGGALRVTGDGGLFMGSHFPALTLLQAQHALTVEHTLTIDSSRTLALQGGTLIARNIVAVGGFQFLGGTLELTGPSGLTIGSTGDAPLFTSGLSLYEGSTLHVAGPVGIDPGRLLQLSGGAMSAESIAVQPGGEIQWTSGRLSVGVFHGSLVNPGVFAPGRSAGGSTVLGNYTQLGQSTLEIEVGGTATATQFDFVNVTGTAQLGGELRLSLINGFTPTSAQTFEVFNAGTLIGFFTNAGNGQRVWTTDGSGSFLVNYGPTSAFNPNRIVLSGFQRSKPGDFDLDGDVDGADFLRWQRGQSPNPLSPADLAHWKTNFATAESAAVPAPEPAANILAAVAVVTLASGQRKQRLA